MRWNPDAVYSQHLTQISLSPEVPVVLRVVSTLQRFLPVHSVCTST